MDQLIQPAADPAQLLVVDQPLVPEVEQEGTLGGGEGSMPLLQDRQHMRQQVEAVGLTGSLNVPRHGFRPRMEKSGTRDRAQREFARHEGLKRNASSALGVLPGGLIGGSGGELNKEGQAGEQDTWSCGLGRRRAQGGPILKVARVPLMRSPEPNSALPVRCGAVDPALGQAVFVNLDLVTNGGVVMNREA